MIEELSGILFHMKRKHLVSCHQTSLISLTLISSFVAPDAAIAAPPRTPDKTVNCEILVVGGGLSGVATAYEGLLAGRTDFCSRNFSTG